MSIKYKPKDQRTKVSNQSNKYIQTLIKSDYERYDSNLMNDYKKLLEGRCIYLPNFICQVYNYSYFDDIMNEIKNNNCINWSKHKKYENPDFSKTFNLLVDKVSKQFNIVVHQTRLNYYQNGYDYKPFHHDSHAYAHNDIKEDTTIGISLGASRSIEFLHEQTGNKFSFPQNNGDVFAFDSEINSLFMHGIPMDKTSTEPRLSIIVWGHKT